MSRRQVRSSRKLRFSNLSTVIMVPTVYGNASNFQEIWSGKSIGYENAYSYHEFFQMLSSKTLSNFNVLNEKPNVTTNIMTGVTFNWTEKLKTLLFGVTYITVHDRLVRDPFSHFNFQFLNIKSLFNYCQSFLFFAKK